VGTTKTHGSQLAANKIQIGTKPARFFGEHSTELTSFINMLDKTAKTAKPLCVGSIPTRLQTFSTT
jgi:hypothetical protein